MALIDDLKYKQKGSLIVVCTLGLGAIFEKDLRPVWMTNLFENTTIGTGDLAWVFKILSYTVLGLLVAAIMFVIHLVKLIYYSIKINKLTS
jgi:hypothetical protein